MFACACAPESVCAGRKGARQTSPRKRPESSSFTRGLQRGAGVGAGPRAREGSGRGCLCRAVAAHAPRSLARAPAPQPRGAPRPRPASTRAGRGPLSAGARDPGVGVGIGSEPAGLPEEESGASRGRRRRREREAAVAAARPGPPALSRATCMGHPQGGRQTAEKRCARLLRSCPRAAARMGETPEDPAPLSTWARPNYLSPSSLRPPPPQPPSPRCRPRARRTAPAPGARVGAPAWAPGRPGCEGIFHSFLSRAQTGTLFLPLGCSAA